jgi:hypothetical protein
MHLVPRIKCRYSVHNAGNFITGCGDSSSFLWQKPTNCCSDLVSIDWSVAHGWCTMTQLLSRRGPLCFPVIMYSNFSALSTCKITRQLTLEHLIRFERSKVRLGTLARYKVQIPEQRLGLTYTETAWSCISCLFCKAYLYNLVASSASYLSGVMEVRTSLAQYPQTLK